MLPRAMPESAQWTVSVRFWVLPSEKVPVAVNWMPLRLTVMTLLGETAIDTRTALVTVMPSVPLMPPEVATALKVPVVWPVATPVELTTPTEGVCEDQVTELVRFCVVPSE